MSLSMLREDGQEIDDDDVTLPWYNNSPNLQDAMNVDDSCINYHCIQHTILLCVFDMNVHAAGKVLLYSMYLVKKLDVNAL